MVTHQLSRKRRPVIGCWCSTTAAVQQGRHQELLAEPGTYRRLWERSKGRKSSCKVA